jgi:hypothetical protein
LCARLVLQDQLFEALGLRYGHVFWNAELEEFSWLSRNISLLSQSHFDESLQVLATISVIWASWIRERQDFSDILEFKVSQVRIINP